MPECNKSVCRLKSFLQIINGGSGRPVMMSLHLASFQREREKKREAKQKLKFSFKSDVSTPTPPVKF